MSCRGISCAGIVRRMEGEVLSGDSVDGSELVYNVPMEATVVNSEIDLAAWLARASLRKE